MVALFRHSSRALGPLPLVWQTRAAWLRLEADARPRRSRADSLFINDMAPLADFLQDGLLLHNVEHQ